MKPPKKTPEALREAPVPTSGGSYILDEATGTLTRQMPAAPDPVEAAVEAPVEPNTKEAR